MLLPFDVGIIYLLDVKQMYTFSKVVEFIVLSLRFLPWSATEQVTGN